MAETGQLAFDHATILADGLDRARSKLEYTPLATAFVGPEFTIAELRHVYAAVWGEDLHAGNFHRKVLSVPGFVERDGGDDDPWRRAWWSQATPLPRRRRPVAAPGAAAPSPRRGRAMTFDEAVQRINAARSFADLSSSSGDPGLAYKMLVKIVHPDVAPAGRTASATAAIARLSALWDG